MACLLAIGTTATTGTAFASEALPYALQADLESVVQAKVNKLLSQKNEDGVAYLRGAYSKKFRRVDGNTFQVTFHQDTAEGSHLKTERLLLTLSNASGKWTITDEKVQDTYTGLYRGAPGDEEFYRFESMQFDREGLKVTATNGSLAKDFLEGQPARFWIFADKIDFEYDPPKDLDYYQLHRQVVLKEYGQDFDFPVKSVRFECVAPSCDELESSIFSGLRKVSMTDVHAELQKDYKEALQEFQDNIAENPFRYYRLLPEEDRRNYTVYIERAGGKDHQIGLDVDNYEPKEVTFFAAKYGPVYSYYSEETRAKGVPPYELELRPDLSARQYDVVTFEGTVELGLEDSQAIDGDMTFVINIKEDLRELPIAISRLRTPGQDTSEAKDPTLFLNSIQDDKGNELTWVKTGPYSALLVFPEKVRAGTQQTLNVQFTSFDSIARLNPSYAYMDRGGWLPIVRFPDRIEEMNLTVKVQDKYQVLGIGKKISESTEDGVNTTVWESESPGALPTVIFGEYISATPDFKATKLDGTEIPVTVYVDKVSTHAVTSFEDYAAGAGDVRGKQLKSIAEQAANALNLFKTVYKVDYPYAKLDLVAAPFQGGAQAPPSIVYLDTNLFRGEGAIGHSGGTEGTRFIKDTVAHETGHQWFAHLVSHANSRHYWFVESLAEYSSALYVENVYGKKEYLDKVEAWRQDILKWEVLSSVNDAGVLWGGEFPGPAYIANVYNKGPYAFHMLRETYGDEKFFNFLALLVGQLQNKSIVTRDIQGVAEQAYGVPMEWFFDQWIRGVGIPEYTFDYATRQTEDGSWLIQGTVKQKVRAGKNKYVLDDVYYLGAVPITVLARKSKKEYRVLVRVEGPESQFAFKVPEEPLEVAFNKYGEILAYDVVTHGSN